MIRLFINALAATAGGGITYIKNVVPELSARDDVHTSLLVPRQLRDRFSRSANLDVLDCGLPSGAALRFWREQRLLPQLIRQQQAHVLLSAGNFALRNSPVPQILLSRNALYTSSVFYRDLIRRHEYRMWLETKVRGALAKKSVGWADITVAPSQAFADEVRRWTGRDILVIHHGFDRHRFIDKATPLSADVEQKVASARDALKLLHVSHYNYYRNFETLFRALPLIRDRIAPRPVRLFLTCKLESHQNPGAYKTERAAALVRELGISANVVQLGTVPYESLASLYKACDVYVTAAYAESFAHPLVEAKACGLPIAASDITVHREIGGQSAVFVPVFASDLFGAAVAEIVSRTANTPKTLLSCVREFSWSDHVSRLLKLAGELASSGRSSPDFGIAAGEDA